MGRSRLRAAAERHRSPCIAVQGEDTVEVAQFEHSPHPGFGDHQLEVAIKKPNPLERTDEHAETERVNEIDPRQIEHEMVHAVRHRVHHVLAQLGCADDIKFASHGENRPLAVSVSVHHDVHHWHGIGPQPCDSVTGGS